MRLSEKVFRKDAYIFGRIYIFYNIILKEIMSISNYRIKNRKWVLIMKKVNYNLYFKYMTSSFVVLVVALPTLRNMLWP